VSDADDGYRECAPPPALATHVAALWTRQVPYDGRIHVHPVVPDGCMDLIWVDGALLVAGPDTGPHPAVSRPGAVYAAVRFRPGVAPAVLGVPAHALRDGRVPLEELWHGGDVRRLADAVAAAPGPRGAVRLLGVTAGTRLREATSPDPAAAAIVARLRRGVSVTALATELGWSERQFHRRCTIAFGYGPKTLQRILRFQRAVALARAGHAFAEAAAVAGYADQAHLAREVRALAGMPLGELVGSAQGVAGAAGSSDGANRSTPLPSGSCRTA